MLLINLLIAIILDTYKELQKAEESREAVPWRAETAWTSLGVQRLWFGIHGFMCVYMTSYIYMGIY
jgi:hypothetical protein